MSDYDYDGDAPGTEGFLGRRSPFTQVGDWVLLSGVSPRAVHLYCVLSMHLNASRGDRMVWPSRKNLAKIMGLARPQSIDGPMQELVDLDAVEVIRRKREDGGNASSKYLVHETPPEGYAGLTALSAFYGVEGKSAGHRGGAKTAQGGRVNRTRGGAETAQPPVRFTAHELEEEEQDEVEPVLPTGVLTREPTGETAFDHDPLLEDLPQKPARRKRKTPWPGEFVPSDELLEWAGKHHPNVDPQAVTTDFNAYWDEPDRKGVERDWAATWRRRITDCSKGGWSQYRAKPPVDKTHQEKADQLGEYWWGQCQQAGVIHGERYADLVPLLLEFISDPENPVEQRPLYEALKVCREPIPPKWKIRAALRGTLGAGPVVDAAGRPVSRQEQVAEARNERSMERANLLTSYNERTGAKLTLMDLQVMKSRGQEIPEELKILLAPLSAQAAGPPAAPVLGATVIQGEVSA